MSRLYVFYNLTLKVVTCKSPIVTIGLQIIIRCVLNYTSAFKPLQSAYLKPAWSTANHLQF